MSLAPAKWADLLAPPSQEVVDRALHRLADEMRARYGSRLRGVYLFGSRARGDFKPFSDVDVAVVVDGGERVLDETRALSDLAYDLLLETSAHIQPWLFSEREWFGERSGVSALVRSARDDARAIWMPAP